MGMGLLVNNMKIRKFFLTTIVLSGALCLLQACGQKTADAPSQIEQKSADDQVVAYREAVKQFEEVTVAEFKELVADGEVVYVYFGRETCSTCRRFAPQLAKQAKTAGTKIYYMSTEDGDNLEKQALRKEYQVSQVPSLLKLSNTGYSAYQADKDPLDQFLKP